MLIRENYIKINAFRSTFTFLFPFDQQKKRAYKEKKNINVEIMKRVTEKNELRHVVGKKHISIVLNEKSIIFVCREMHLTISLSKRNLF